MSGKRNVRARRGMGPASADITVHDWASQAGPRWGSSRTPMREGLRHMWAKDHGFVELYLGMKFGLPVLGGIACTWIGQMRGPIVFGMFPTEWACRLGAPVWDWVAGCSEAEPSMAMARADRHWMGTEPRAPAANCARERWRLIEAVANALRDWRSRSRCGCLLWRLRSRGDGGLVHDRLRGATSTPSYAVGSKHTGGSRLGPWRQELVRLFGQALGGRGRAQTPPPPFSRGRRRTPLANRCRPLCLPGLRSLARHCLMPSPSSGMGHVLLGGDSPRNLRSAARPWGSSMAADVGEGLAPGKGPGRRGLAQPGWL